MSIGWHGQASIWNWWSGGRRKEYDNYGGYCHQIKKAGALSDGAIPEMKCANLAPPFSLQELHKFRNSLSSNFSRFWILLMLLFVFRMTPPLSCTARCPKVGFASVRTEYTLKFAELHLLQLFGQSRIFHKPVPHYWDSNWSGIEDVIKKPIYRVGWYWIYYTTCWNCS